MSAIGCSMLMGVVCAAEFDFQPVNAVSSNLNHDSHEILIGQVFADF